MASSFHTHPPWVDPWVVYPTETAAPVARGGSALLPSTTLRLSLSSCFIWGITDHPIRWISWDQSGSRHVVTTVVTTSLAKKWQILNSRKDLFCLGLFLSRCVPTCSAKLGSCGCWCLSNMREMVNDWALMWSWTQIESAEKWRFYPLTHLIVAVISHGLPQHMSSEYVILIYKNTCYVSGLPLQQG